MIFCMSLRSHLAALFRGNCLRRCLVFSSCLLLYAAQTESKAEQLLDRLLDVREAILASGAPADAAFLTVWDFDGTILDGDCSEGLERDGRTVYPGVGPAFHRTRPVRPVFEQGRIRGILA